MAILVLVAFLLLELNRFLPGSWPGGGGDGGSRTLPTGSTADPKRLVPSPSPPPPSTPSPRGDAIRLVVRRTDGVAAAAGSVRLEGSTGRAALDFVGGEAVLDAGAPPPTEFVIVTPGAGPIAHGRPPSGLGTPWIVVLPKHPPSSVEGVGSDGEASPRIRVVGADGRPVAGAAVTIAGSGGERRVETDREGEAALGPSRGVERVCIEAPGFGERCFHARLGRRGAERVLSIQLAPTRPHVTTFVDPATGEALSARSLTLLDRQGRAKRLVREGGTFDRFDTTLPDDVAAETTLEIDVDGRPPVRVPLEALAGATPIPAGVARHIQVLDDAGRPISGAAVTVRFAAGSTSERDGDRPIERIVRTDAQGRVELSLPLDRDADLRVDATPFASEGRRVERGVAASDAPIEVRLSRGTEVRVAVRDALGAPVVGASVLVMSAAGRTTARRETTTDATGAATVAGVAPGRIEIVVHRAGFAWASWTGVASPDAAPVGIALAPGKRLALVVEDPDGVPLARVAVRSVPRPDAGSGVPDAWDPDGAAWETDENGVLTIDDLADREIDVYLAKAGYLDEIVAKVRPGAATWFATLVPRK